MDSLTQLTLGAAVGEACLGKRMGKAAPLWGAFLGTLPDLDVLANPFLTEMQSLAFHRSLTHSILFMVLASPLLGLLLQRFHPTDRGDAPVPWTQWAGLAFAVLSTHVLLDCLTTYGTQIFWPFSTYPVILGSIFIIDPLYTVPLAAGLLVSLWWSPGAQTRRRANTIGLAISSLYLAVTLVNKATVEHVFQSALTAQNLPSERVFTKPTAFNNILWTGIAEAENGFYVGFYSLLDDDDAVDFRFVPHNHHLMKDAWTDPAMKRLRWFSRGYFTVSEGTDGQLYVHDLRFGRSDLGLTRDGNYIFTFQMKRDGGRLTGFTQTRPPVRATDELLQRFVARIRGDESVVPVEETTAPGSPAASG